MRIEVHTYGGDYWFASIDHGTHKLAIGEAVSCERSWLATVRAVKVEAQRSGEEIALPAMGQYPAVVLTPDGIAWDAPIERHRGPITGVTRYAQAPDVPGYAWCRYNSGSPYLCPVAEYGEAYVPGLLG